MTRTQKRKFTLALNSFLRVRKKCHAFEYVDVLHRDKNALMAQSNTKRARLYRVVEELIGEGVK